MKLKTFLGLNTPEQYEEFSDNCKFLEHYIDNDGIKHHLYSLHDFYVELTSIDGNLDPNFNAFIDGPRLEKYMLGDLLYIHKILKIDSSGSL